MIDLGDVVRAYQICGHCHVVDQDHGRVQHGHVCATCGEPGHEGGMMYFESSIHTMAALIQEASKQLVRRHREIDASQIHNVSIVIFFCTVREALLNWFIKQLSRAQKIPKPIYARLLADNDLHSKRQNMLLPSLTGKKWKALVAEESVSSGINYHALNSLIKRSVDARNSLVHEGRPWQIDDALAMECVNQFPAMLSFYIALHNRYVHPLHLTKSK